MWTLQAADGQTQMDPLRADFNTAIFESIGAAMLTIRPANADDAKELTQIYAENLANGLVPASYEKAFLENTFNRSVLSLVATLRDDVVACGTVHFLELEST